MKLDGYKKREFFTITELCSAARCLRHYFYSAGCGLRFAAPGTGSDAADFGTAIHKAIPILLSEGNLDKAYDAFLKEWEGHVGDDKRNAQTAKMILFTFLSSHPFKQGLYEILPPPIGLTDIKIEDSISDWEVSFAINIPGLPLPLIGRVDGHCRLLMGGDHYGLEYKTTGEMSQRFFNGFKRNPQILGYTLAMRHVDTKVKGVLVEAIGVAKTTWKVQTIPVQPLDYELEDFIKWAQYWGATILECEARQEWPKDVSACTTYPQFYQPGYLCNYDMLCSSEDWTQFRSFYNEKRHEPYVLPKVKGQEIQS